MACVAVPANATVCEPDKANDPEFVNVVLLAFLLIVSVFAEAVSVPVALIVIPDASALASCVTE